MGAPKPKASARRAPNSLDEESRALLYEGANLSQLGILFGMDHRVLVEKLHGVPPVGRRGATDIYSIREVAPKLVRPDYDIETYIRKMNHTDLPKMLSKEYWAGQRSRQEFMLKAGDLWETAKVIEKVGELYKMIRMSMLLMIDSVERQVELTPRQRDIIKELADGTLRDLHKTVIEHFGEPSEAQEVNDEEL